jgi:hypothetical protein
MLISICTTSRPKLLGDVTEFLIEAQNLIPAEFLKMVANCRRENLPEEAEVEYARSERIAFSIDRR